MFGSTYGFTLNLRAAFSCTEIVQPYTHKEIAMAVVQRAFDNLDWDCLPDKDNSMLYGSTFRWPELKMKQETVGEKIVRFLNPVGHYNGILRGLPDQITWTFSASGNEVAADVRIFISKQKMWKGEAKEKLSNVTNTLFNEIARCAQLFGMSLSVTRAKDK